MRKEEIRTGEKLLRVVEDDTSLNICIILGGGLSPPQDRYLFI